MNPFEAIDRLTHRVSVYVPSTNDINRAVDASVKVNDTLAKLSSLFGGSTAYNVHGAWVSDKAGLVIEDVTICQSYASALPDDKLEAVYDIAAQLKADMGQEAVAVEIDRNMYFV
jgi:hypothetical protein